MTAFNNNQTTSRKWLVFISAYWVKCSCISPLYVFGQLFNSIQTTFNSSRVETVLIQSTIIGVIFLTGIVNGILTHIYGPRVVGIIGSVLCTTGFTVSYFASSATFLMITIGCVAAVGISMLEFANSTATAQHFRGKSGILAMSLALTGGGLGGMGYPYLLDYFRNRFGLHGTLLIIGGITLHSLPCALLWKPQMTLKKGKSSMFTIDLTQSYPQNIRTIDQPKSTTTTKKVSVSELESRTKFGKLPVFKSLIHLLKNKVFLAFNFATVLSFSAISVFLVFIADIFKENGYKEDNVTFGLFLMSGLNILGRLCPGILMNIRRLSTLSTSITTTFLALTSILIIIFGKSLEIFLLISATSGFVLGVYTSQYSVVTMKLVGTEHLPNAMGIMFFFSSIGSTTAGPVAGVLRDKTGSYTVSFVSMAGIIAVSLILYSLANYWRSKQHKKYTVSVA